MLITYFLSFLLLYRYAAIFVVTFLSSLVLPLPESAFLMAAGAFASQGYLEYPEVIAVGLAGTVAGDMSSYFLSRKYGKGFLMKIGFRRILRAEWFRELEENFSERAASSVFFSRFAVTWLGTTVNVLSGLAKLRLRTFLWADIAGEAIYVVAVVGTGYVFGDVWQNVSSVTEYLAGILAILMLLYFLRLMNRRRRRRKRSTVDSG